MTTTPRPNSQAKRIVRAAARLPSRWRVLRVRARLPTLALTITPLDAVVLAIDSARRSGHAVYHRGSLVSWGECKSRDASERAEVIRAALRLAQYAGIPAGLALETPFGGSLSVLLSLNATVTLWRDSWLAHQQPESRIVELQARQWRRALFGASKMPRDAVRRLELVTARQIIRRDHSADPVELGGDAAAAICLGNVARTSSALHSALNCKLAEPPPRRQRSSARRTP